MPADKPDLAQPGGELIYRQRAPVRLWHWVNAFSIFVMIMSGLMIFNAHPRLYWGRYGANQDTPWLVIGSAGERGFLQVGAVTVPTTGVLGVAGGRARAFPSWATIPSSYNLADARQWHFFFAWLLVVPTLLFYAWGFVSRHVQRDLAPTRAELRPGHIWRDVKDHARLRFHTGDEAKRYNILQKLSYVGVIFVALPLLALTGLTMSPGMNAAWPWALDLFGGRQSARSLHFISMAAIVLFIVVHLVMVVVAGPLNEMRSIVTGWWRVPQPKEEVR